jgi:hypothetical protein
MAITPSFQRRDIGRKLFEFTIKRGVESVSLFTEFDFFYLIPFPSSSNDGNI